MINVYSSNVNNINAQQSGNFFVLSNTNSISLTLTPNITISPDRTTLTITKAGIYTVWFGLGWVRANTTNIFNLKLAVIQLLVNGTPYPGGTLYSSLNGLTYNNPTYTAGSGASMTKVLIPASANTTLKFQGLLSNYNIYYTITFVLSAQQIG